MAKNIVSEKQQAILHSAQALFTELGYDGASFEKISSNAGVAFGLIRHYYKNKNNLYVLALADSMHALHEYIVGKTADAASGLDALLDGVRAYIELASSDDKRGKLVTSAEPGKLTNDDERQRIVAEFDASIVSLFSNFIVRGVEDRSIRAIDPRQSALVVLGLLHGLAQVSALAESAISPNAILEFIASSMGASDKS